MSRDDRRNQNEDEISGIPDNPDYTEDAEPGIALVSESKYEGTCGDDVTWVLEDGLLTISGTGEMKDYTIYGTGAPWGKQSASIVRIVIEPGITHIGDAAFYWCENLLDVTIPDSVTSLGAWCFDFCENLQGLTIPDSVTDIGKYAFCRCSSLKSITIPDSVQEIGEYAFSECDRLASVKLSSNLTFLGGYAFSDCGSLTGIVIPGSLAEIGENAFNDCTGMTSVSIENGVTCISWDAFIRCRSLKSVKIPDSVTTIHSYAFAGCNSMTDLTISSSVTEIEPYVFGGCKSLQSVTISKGVTTIGQAAFRGCTSLASVEIPLSLNRVGSYAFDECTNLTDVYYEGSQYDWWGIGIESRNAPLKNAEVHYLLATPTPKPTATPTPKPTNTPTPKPTATPTPKPTATPTPSPRPTASPTPAMEKPTITFVYNSQKGGDIRWKKGGKGVTGYVVYRQRSAEGIKKVAIIKDVNTLQCIDPGIVTGCWGRVYHYYICYLYGSKEGPKSDKLVLQRLAPIKITSLKNSAAGKVTCTYACTVNENKALGYEIQYAQTKQDLFDRKGTFKKVGVTGRKNLSKVISGFTKGKTYYFRVRCYVDYEHSVTHQKTKTWS